jgi:hypothetical protein
MWCSSVVGVVFLTVRPRSTFYYNNIIMPLNDNIVVNETGDPKKKKKNEKGEFTIFKPAYHAAFTTRTAVRV